MGESRGRLTSVDKAGLVSFLTLRDMLALNGVNPMIRLVVAAASVTLALSGASATTINLAYSGASPAGAFPATGTGGGQVVTNVSNGAITLADLTYFDYQQNIIGGGVLLDYTLAGGDRSRWLECTGDIELRLAVIGRLSFDQ